MNIANPHGADTLPQQIVVYLIDGQWVSYGDVVSVGEGV